MTAQQLGQDLAQAREDYRIANDAWERAKADEGTQQDRTAQAMAEAGRIERQIEIAEESERGLDQVEALAKALAKAREERPGLADRMMAHATTYRNARTALHAAEQAQQDCLRQAHPRRDHDPRHDHLPDPSRQGADGVDDR